MFRRIFKSSEPAGLTPRDVEMLRQFRLLGADLARRRQVDHFFFVPSEHDARALAEDLGGTTSLASGEGRWSVHATVEMTLTEIEVAAARARFEALAQKYRGTYDGWGAAAD